MTPSLSNLKHGLSHVVFKTQKSEGGVTEWFWLPVTDKVVVKLLSGGVVI